jgi:hypothetical protein
MTNVRLFHGAREAKEFLVSKIVEEALHQGTPLSEAERKMLCFSETDWTLPDMSAVSDEFDRAYDQDEYEAKVAGLVKHVYKKILKDSGDEYDKWWSAIRLLSKQDHYILVMIRQAALRPRGDQLKLFGAALGIVIVIVSLEFLWLFVNNKYRIDSHNYWPSQEKAGFLFWIAAMGLAAATSLLYYASRAKILEGFFDRIFKRFDRAANKKG